MNLNSAQDQLALPMFQGGNKQVDAGKMFDQLLTAESEAELESILNDAGLLGPDESMWQPLGGFENNFAAVANQQSDPTAAFIEKIINSIDAVLMAKCFDNDIDPEGPSAPESMGAAVERFFNVREGRIGYLDARQREALAENIHVVAVGSKPPGNPNYLIVDRGEGQTPARFPDTFLSIQKSNKMRIPFVQGKFNSGGLGVLQFCGSTHNFQLIVSRRHPSAPSIAEDTTRDMWGFTIIRRLRPSQGRKSSEYVYLAPNGKVPAFCRDAIRVLPGPSRKNAPGEPYARELPYGTCLKLYEYSWKARSMATTEVRYAIDRLFHVPALPFRVHETRPYSANFFSTTVSGGWDTAVTGEFDGGSTKLENGFPGSGELDLPGIGRLPYQVAVYKPHTKKEHVPQGVYFDINGQVHGQLRSDFVSRRLKFDRLKDDLFVAVDCTNMEPRAREDFFMASRDRVRRNEDYSRIEDALTDELRSHPGLQEVNQLRRQHEMEKSIGDDAALEAFQRLLKSDPTLQSLFAPGDRLVTSTGPSKPSPFEGRRFPSFFRLAKEPKGGLVKDCPINRTCHVEFVTDAMNDYFVRLDSPGSVTIDPPNLVERQRLWNGTWSTFFRAPWDAQVGDVVEVTVEVTDVDRQSKGSPFLSSFTMRITPPDHRIPPPGPKPPPPGPVPDNSTNGVTLAFPAPREVTKAEWSEFNPPFHSKEAIRVSHGGESDYDYVVNVDCAFLLTELSRSKDDAKPQVRFWFTYGLVLAAVGMIKHQKSLTTLNLDDQPDQDEEDALEDLKQVSEACNGLARVIVPLVASLGKSAAIE